MVPWIKVTERFLKLMVADLSFFFPVIQMMI